jgi:hypothetical protein
MAGAEYEEVEITEREKHLLYLLWAEHADRVADNCHLWQRTRRRLYREQAKEYRLIALECYSV